MTNYDIAAGISQSGINQTVAKLYALEEARSKLFEGSVTKSDDTLGSVRLDFEALASPTINLTPPTQSEWDSAIKASSDTAKPGDAAFRLEFSKIRGKATYSDTSLEATGALTVYGEVQFSGSRVSVDVRAVSMDQSSFGAWDQFIVNVLLVPTALRMASQTLSGIVIPALPTIEGIEFQPLALRVEPRGIALGTTRAGQSSPDLSDFAFPDGDDPFILVTIAFINALAADLVPTQARATGEEGGSGFNASYEFRASDLSVVSAIRDERLHFDVRGTYSGSLSVGGVGTGIAKAVLCPIQTAVDAISNPSDWDRITGSLSIQLSPNPTPVPVELTVSEPDDSGRQSATLAMPTSLANELDVSATPRWSGVSTATFVSLGLSAVVAVMPGALETMILKSILGGLSFPSLVLGPFSTSIPDLPDGANITATALAQPGRALQPFGAAQLCQTLQVEFS